jgi:SecD/SecF fusion protein
MSCQPSSIEKDGGLLIEVEYNIQDYQDTPILQTLNTLANRINFFCYKNPKVTCDTLKKIIRIELPFESDTNLYKDLILTKGKFETLETYDNTEIFNYLSQINEILKKNDNFGINLTDTIKGSENFPLFSILSPAISTNGQIFDGAIIGYSVKEDTSKVNKIFSIAEIKNCLPENIELLWSKFKENDQYSLVAIKKPVDYIPITDEMIETSRVEKNSINDNYSITLFLKQQFHKDWSNLTRQNIGDFLAIVIDNEVYSSPRVNAEIQGGRTSISGRLNLEQSKILSVVLDNDRIEHDLYIKRIEIFNVP